MRLTGGLLMVLRNSSGMMRSLLRYISRTLFLVS
jgi:hypothetical protein